MDKRKARLVTCMISNFLENHSASLPSSYLEIIENKLANGQIEEVLTFVENRLENTKKINSNDNKILLDNIVNKFSNDCISLGYRIGSVIDLIPLEEK